jgi:hypothetical protein
VPGDKKKIQKKKFSAIIIFAFLNFIQNSSFKVNSPSVDSNIIVELRKCSIFDRQWRKHESKLFINLKVCKKKSIAKRTDCIPVTGHVNANVFKQSL